MPDLAARGGTLIAPAEVEAIERAALLEAIRALKRAGARPKRSIELFAFTSEEPTRFGIGCMGSRLMAGVSDTESDADYRHVSGNMGGVLSKARGDDPVRARADRPGPLGNRACSAVRRGAAAVPGRE